jgi:threonine dehydrogenase-like Zn-dependent dehydrogenase
VRVDVARVGICGSELSGYLGHSSLRKPPLIMGHEFAGVIGDAEDSALIGRRVVINPLVSCGECEYCAAGRDNLCEKRQVVGAHRPGGMAGSVNVPLRNCTPLPDGVDMTTASLVEPLACSLRAVRNAASAPDDVLVILGAGPIGLLSLAAARQAGVRQVLITDVSPARLAVARAWGASQALDVRSENVLDAVRALRKHGAHQVIDAVGADGTRAQACEIVSAGGRVVLIGLHSEASPFPANAIIRREVTLTGTFAYSRADFADALALLTNGLLTDSPGWIEERPLSAGGQAFADLIAGAPTAAKIVLTIDD